jgi:hypothetical protein
VRAPNVRATRSRPEPISSTARDGFRDWVARHVVADDPYGSEDLQKPAREEQSPLWIGVGLALMLLSGIISISGLIMLWRWLAG